MSGNVKCCHWSSFTPSIWFCIFAFQYTYFHRSCRFFHFKYKSYFILEYGLLFGFATALFPPNCIAVRTKSMGCSIYPYLDDWPVTVSSCDEPKLQVSMIIKTCKKSGLVINHEKSCIEPSQQTSCIGAFLNSAVARVFHPTCGNGLTH